MANSQKSASDSGNAEPLAEMIVNAVRADAIEHGDFCAARAVRFGPRGWGVGAIENLMP